MRTLGLENAAQSFEEQVRHSQAARLKRTREARVAAVSAIDRTPTRVYSLRSRQQKDASNESHEDEGHVDAKRRRLSDSSSSPLDDEPLEYEDSSVFRYTCTELRAARALGLTTPTTTSTITSTTTSSTSDTGDTEAVRTKIVGFAPLQDALDGSTNESDRSATSPSSQQEQQRYHRRIVLPNLLRAYSMVFSSASEHRPRLLLLGGHAGQVAVCGLEQQDSHTERDDATNDGDAAEQDARPLLSFRAHSSWLSDCHFVAADTEKARLCVTAANDAAIKLWDLSQTTKYARGLTAAWRTR